MSSVSLPIAWRGLNAGSCTPLPLLVCPQPRLLKPSSAYARFYQAGPPSRPRRPPSVQSPFAQLGCYLRWGDVMRLLGESYPSVIARIGSCAAPVGLSPPSAFGLVWIFLAGCNQSLLPTAASRRYSENLSLDAGSPRSTHLSGKGSLAAKSKRSCKTERSRDMMEASLMAASRCSPSARHLV